MRAAALLGLALALVGGSASAAPPTKAECLAANDAAQDLRRAGKLIEARAKLTLCVADSCPGPVREDCAERLKDVESAMPSVVFEVTDAKGNDVAAVRVRVDDAPSVEVTGSPLVVDPGGHRFAFEGAAGASSKTVVVREGDKGRHVAVVLGSAAAVAGAPSPSAPEPSVPPSDPGATQRTLGLIVGGAGGIAVVLGAVFGLVAKSTYDGAGCPDACRGTGYSDANSQATISTVSFVAGGALLVGGAALYLTAPRSIQVGVGPSGLAVAGAW